MLDMAKGRAAGGEEADRVRDVVRRLRDERFKGSQVETAKALGVAPPTISDLLSGKRGPGMQLLDNLRRVTGKSLDELLFGQPFGPPSDQEGMVRSSVVVASLLEGWAEAEAQARVRFPDVPSWAWEAARDATPPPGADATVDLAADLAYVAWRYTGEAERQRYEAIALARASERLRAAPKSRH